MTQFDYYEFFIKIREYEIEINKQKIKNQEYENKISELENKLDIYKDKIKKYEEKMAKDNIPMDQYLFHENYNQWSLEFYKYFEEYKNCSEEYDNFLDQHLKLLKEYTQFAEKGKTYFEKHPAEFKQIKKEMEFYALNETRKELIAEKEEIISLLKDAGIDYESTKTVKTHKNKLRKKQRHKNRKRR